jgi:hypothetical protein
MCRPGRNTADFTLIVIITNVSRPRRRQSEKSRHVHASLNRRVHRPLESWNDLRFYPASLSSPLYRQPLTKLASANHSAQQ